MTKISVTGTKKDLKNVIDKLHQLEVLDIRHYEGELSTGSPFKSSEAVSELLVDIRSLKSKLPEPNQKTGEKPEYQDLGDTVKKLNKRVEELEEEKSEIKKDISSIKDQKKFFSKLKGTGLKIEELEGTETLSVFIGEIDEQKFQQNTSSDAYQICNGEKASVIFYKNDVEEFENNIREARNKEYNLIETEFEGEVEEVISSIESLRKQLKQQLKSKDQQLQEISDKWSGLLKTKESELDEEIQKAEAPIKFASTENSFIAEGWVPSEKMPKLEEELAKVTKGKIHVQEEDTEEEPPVKHNNNKLVKPFEDFTDLIAVPRYNEIDPSFMLLLTFPLFFGLMIGDVGYGLTSALVFLAGIKYVPEASDMFKALLWTSAATVIFGLIYGEMFGFQIYESPFYRADYWTEIFYIALGIGVAHINIGLLFGAYNEYVNHGLMEAIYAKISWIILEIAAVAGYLIYTSIGSTPGTAVIMGLGIPAIAMIYKGEGMEGIVEIPSLLSNIISYLRLFGVCMAAYTLAGTANAIAAPALTSGTILGITAGILILIGAHTMLTFIKIMEGAIQGIRLHYVEMFGWFYEGGGKKYAPFGAKNS